MSDLKSGPDSHQEIVILGGARTPMGEFIGPLKDFSAIDLGVIAARAALERDCRR
jgi:acetyl-CoA C-acetyltransferase